MGKKNKEHKKKVQARNQRLGIVGRKAISFASHGAVVNELSQGSVMEQTNRLNELVGLGNLPSNKLKETIMKNAPKEMDKAIKKYKKQGRDITVDDLLSEVRSEHGFLKMCERVGLDYQWFENLALSRMEAHGIKG